MKFREIHGHAFDMDRVKALVASPKCLPKPGLFVQMVGDEVFIECDDPVAVVRDFLATNKDLQNKRSAVMRWLFPDSKLELDYKYNVV